MHPPNVPSKSRVILLLDLDCFYAQAACIRLGYNSLDTPLALFQWNSVLAVTYPARTLYKVKRGDSWETVAQKSERKCLGVHVPILEHDTSTDNTTDNTISSLREEYEHLYVLKDEESRQKARKKEVGVRKLSSQGKASIECYRIASARIFETVQEFLETNFPGGVVLERASIDEFFLDVTAAVEARRQQETECLTHALQETNIVTCQKETLHPDKTDETINGLQLGCWIAHGIRKAVRETLGFTMSAGIAHNKTIAKLAASYGKPNGQAVCYPETIASMLYETPISKCRFLGGKLGDAVTKLLPEGSETTVGGIAKHLSLFDLQKGMKDASTARWVHDIAHGIDNDTVVSKEETSLLPKSITAFKSMNFAPPGSKIIGHSLQDATKWIQLLAHEVVGRVERDAARNRRYPKMCTVQYATERTQSNKSMRIPFPLSKWSTERKVSHMIEAVTKAIEPRLKNGGMRLHRVGICATDFESRDESTKSIATLFQTASSGKTATTLLQTAQSTGKQKTVSTAPPQPSVDACCAKDLEIAQKLQSSFDREQRMVEILDKRQEKKRRKEGPRIDQYFCKKR